MTASASSWCRSLRAVFLALLLGACQPAPGPATGAHSPTPDASPPAAPPAPAAAAPGPEHRRLKDLLPSRLLGCPRISAKSESTEVLDRGVSLAEADYESAASAATPARKLLLRFTAVKQPGGLVGATAALLEVEIDRETEDGHERSTVLEGRKAYERYSRGARQGEVHVVVADRYLVELSGEGVTMEDLRAALKELDLARLESLSKT